MSRFATACASRRRPRRGQGGFSIVAVLGLTAVLAVMVMASLVVAQTNTTGSAREGRGDLALQVADAGINRYISRLVEDPRYWDHFVDQAEDPRIVSGTGSQVDPGGAWATGASWTYRTGGPRTWVPLQDARFGQAAYSLRITPPAVGTDLVTIEATGRVGIGSPNPLTRTVQAQVHPTSIADFQMISNETIKYGADAVTQGKIYSAKDVNHLGTARAPVYGQHWVCQEPSTFSCPRSETGSGTFKAGAYDATTTPSFRDKFPTPIDFSHFTQSLNDIKGAAQAGGIYRNDPTATGWLLQFVDTGQVRIWKLTGNVDLGYQVGTINCGEIVQVPANGAMYFEQSVVVGEATEPAKADTCRPNPGYGPRESVVDGRVTVATKSNIYIGGDISYEQVGDDVLGLIATGSVIITEYSPRQLEWRAASLAQSGEWRTNRGDPDNKHALMKYVGSQTTNQGGYASMFASRDYNWDESLAYLRPPFYPIIEGSWTVQYWREVTPS